MIEIVNPYSGASFNHTSENCNAAGSYRVENGAIKDIAISGSVTKGGETYNFAASRDDQGNVNIAGVAPAALAEVGAAVAVIVAEVEAAAIPVTPKSSK